MEIFRLIEDTAIMGDRAVVNHWDYNLELGPLKIGPYQSGGKTISSACVAELSRLSKPLARLLSDPYVSFTCANRQVLVPQALSHHLLRHHAHLDLGVQRTLVGHQAAGQRPTMNHCSAA